MSYVWSVFLELNDARTMGQHTANPLTFESIKAYMDITCTKLSPRDISTIKLVDKEYLSIMNASDKTK